MLKHHSIQLDKKNQLLRASMPLMTILTFIRHTKNHDNIEQFRLQIIEEINAFEIYLSQLHCDAKMILAARYCLCTAIDEVILNQEWGSNSIWSQKSLLSHFHNETWGGERFYLILDELSKDSRDNLEFLEFCYYILSLGFEGKFHGRDIAIREEIRNRLFYRIRNTKSKPDKTLSNLCFESIAYNPVRKNRGFFDQLLMFSLIITVISIFIGNLYSFDFVHRVKKDLQLILTKKPALIYKHDLIKDELNDNAA